MNDAAVSLLLLEWCCVLYSRIRGTALSSFFVFVSICLKTEPQAADLERY